MALCTELVCWGWTGAGDLMSCPEQNDADVTWCRPERLIFQVNGYNKQWILAKIKREELRLLPNNLLHWKTVSNLTQKWGWIIVMATEKWQMRLSVKGEFSGTNSNFRAQPVYFVRREPSRKVPPAAPWCPLNSSHTLTCSASSLGRLRGPNLTTILRTTEHEVCW